MVLKNSVQLKINFFITTQLFFTAVCFSGCGKATDGFAPGISAPTINPSSPAPIVLGSPFFKNGIAVQTSNGWNLQLDTTDSVTPLTTSNGWSIEVKYE